MDINALRTELATDPLARGYSGMTASQAATSLNTANRTQLKTHLSSAEIYEALDVTEFQAKTDAEKQYIRDILGLGGQIAVGSGTKARTVLFAIFANGTNTRNNLIAAATSPNVSRATELGLPTVGAHHVTTARE